MPRRDPRPDYVSGSCEIDLARRELRVARSGRPAGQPRILELLVQSAERAEDSDRCQTRDGIAAHAEDFSTPSRETPSTTKTAMRAP